MTAALPSLAGCPPKEKEPVALRCLEGYGAAELITADMIPPEQEMRADTGSGLAAERIIALPLREAREVFERDYLHAQMLRFSGNISRTAAFIGMERSALHRKLKSLGLSGGRIVTEGGEG